MKRHPSLIPYSQDHHKILLLAQVLKIDSPDYKNMPRDLGGKVEMAQRYFKDIIAPHEDREEKNLFPKIRNIDPEIDKLLDTLISEHEEMNELFQNLNKPTISIDDLNKLGIALEDHVRKEERIVFQLIQEKIPDQLLTQIIH